MQGELKGKRGLVPSNFLEEISEEQMEGEGVGSGEMEIFAASEGDIEQAKRVIAEVSIYTIRICCRSLRSTVKTVSAIYKCMSQCLRERYRELGGIVFCQSVKKCNNFTVSPFFPSRSLLSPCSGI